MRKFRLNVSRNIVYLAVALVFCSCGNEPEKHLPRKRAYPKIVWPSQTYVWEKPVDCPFEFRRSKVTNVDKKETFFGEAPASACWFNLDYPYFDAQVHFSYYSLEGEKSYDRLVQESHALAYEHSKKSSYIDELPIQADNMSGIMFELQGPAASPYQFYLSDDKKHFVRGALYFKTQTRPDSLRPVVQYIKQDLDTLIQSFQWR